jgi:N-acetyl-anhydromuramyl-L-alanine amidase AmpD
MFLDRRLRRMGQVVGLSLSLVLGAAVLAGCRTAPQPGAFERRQGDEIVVAGRFVHTGTRVVLWMDPGGYDAYRVERRFSPIDKADWQNSQAELKDLRLPNRYNLRRDGLTDEEIERVRGGGWDLPTLQKVVDQFVIHYDECGTSRQCFKVLHDARNLSVHFLLDLDGTVYQTLDLKERAWHASASNSRSVGVEIANPGAYGVGEKKPFSEWYARDANGRTRITIPARFGDGGIRTKGFAGAPARPEAVAGTIQGKALVQYDFTPEQYRALIQLTATLSKVFPKLECDCPRDSAGKVILHKLPDDVLEHYRGVLGHFHIQAEKVDPGPAFQWDYVIGGARRLLRGGFSEPADEVSKGHLRAVD